eukprot:Gb_20487 [translate_table: standard]
MMPPLTISLVMLSFLCFCQCHHSQMHPICSRQHKCGIHPIHYPFGQHKGCGHPGFQIECFGSYAVISINKNRFIILEFKYGAQEINIASRITVVHEKFLAQPCALPDPASTYDPAIFRRSPFHKVPGNHNRNLTLFCSCKEPHYSPFLLACNSSCYLSWDNSNSSYTCGSPATDSVSVIPPQPTYLFGGDSTLYWRGIQLEWKDDVNAQKKCKDCESTQGGCGYNASDSKNQGFLCYCQDGPHSRNCTDGSSHLSGDAGSSIGGTMVMIAAIVVVAWMTRRNQTSINRKDFRFEPMEVISNDQSDKSTTNSPAMYSYKQLQEATNFFDKKRKLGDGGFGSVYLGKLQNGLTVAVKKLHEDNSKRSSARKAERKRITLGDSSKHCFRYLDPDYHQSYQLTDKSDVYSFGVVLIEIISAKMVVDTTREGKEIGLANLAISKIQSGALHELVDPDLGFESNTLVKSMVTRVAELAFRCLAAEKDDRPCMMEVASQLEEINQMRYDCRHSVESCFNSFECSHGRAKTVTGVQPASSNSVQTKWSSSSPSTSDTSLT